MSYILKQERNYKDGTHTTLYFKGIALGLFCECVSKETEAKQFRTKKEATQAMKQTGSKWDIIKYGGIENETEQRKIKRTNTTANLTPKRTKTSL